MDSPSGWTGSARLSLLSAWAEHGLEVRAQSRLQALEEVFPGPFVPPRLWATVGSSELAILSLLKVLGTVWCGGVTGMGDPSSLARTSMSSTLPCPFPFGKGSAARAGWEEAQRRLCRVRAGHSRACPQCVQISGKLGPRACFVLEVNWLLPEMAGSPH